MLEQDLRHRAFPLVEKGECLLEAGGREPVGHDRLEVDESSVEQADDAGPGGRRIGAASDDVDIGEHDPVGRDLQHLTRPGDPEEHDAPAGTYELGREIRQKAEAVMRSAKVL